LGSYSLFQYDINNYSSWIGLANWIPFFWCFWGFKNYLDSLHKRKLCSLILIAGSFPVFISGFGQYFFNWFGPMQTLFGSIIWFQRPIPEREGMTGLFNNANYLGAWLNIIWPFCLASLINTKKNFYGKLTISTFIFGTSLSLILTNSRSAWIGMLISIFLIIGRKKYKLFIFLISILLMLIGIIFIFPIFGDLPQNILNKVVPNQIWLEFSDLEISRLDIWNKALGYIFRNPIFGLGAGSFSALYEIDSGIWKGHAHNLIIELLISYGLPGGLLIFGNIFLMLRNAIKKVFLTFTYNQNSIFDVAWITSLIVLLLSQMVDVQYFDARISLVFWILLSGTRNIINKNSST
jgi:O-antigen ligase